MTEARCRRRRAVARANIGPSTTSIACATTCVQLERRTLSRITLCHRLGTLTLSETDCLHWSYQVHCSACRSVLGNDDAFCGLCGALAQPNSCSTCRRPNGPAASFCVHCGSTLFGAGKADLQHARLQPSDERKYVTILCADLLRSTDLIEGLDPEDAIALLEPSLAAMRIAIRQFRGIVSKELGDGVVLFSEHPSLMTAMR